jgi:RNA polymerase sigma-70 factor, ECF subfamily
MTMTYIATLSTSHSRFSQAGSDGGWPSTHDAENIAALRRGDEAVFAALIERYHRALLRVALLYVADQAVAEELVQETWLGLLRSLSRFEGRCSLKTWLFRILVNRAKTRSIRERRSVPFSALRNADDDAADPAVDPMEFDAQGHWLVGPQSWSSAPEEQLLAQETRTYIRQAVDALPASQRAVIELRDIEGWTSDEVCQYLDISEANQRVLLHRARSKVRRALAVYMALPPEL